MTPEREQEISAHLERAEQSIQAARDLVVSGDQDFAASRAYYAAFYGATAILLNEGLDFSKHSGFIASIHQRFVKTGKLSKISTGCLTSVMSEITAVPFTSLSPWPTSY